MPSSVQSFVRYTPDVEQPEEDEIETTQGLVETLRPISEQTLADGGHAMRSVHAKCHGILLGELEVAAARLYTIGSITIALDEPVEAAAVPILLRYEGFNAGRFIET